jgi:hypothetical protein
VHSECTVAEITHRIFEPQRIILAKQMAPCHSVEEDHQHPKGDDDAH